MENFKYDTYIVLELPMQISEQVMTIKRAFKDSFQMAIPADVTIAGSSEVGLLDSNQELNVAFSVLDNIALTIKPIKISFLEGVIFPSTNAFFFSFFKIEMTHSKFYIFVINRVVLFSRYLFSRKSSPIYSLILILANCCLKSQSLGFFFSSNHTNPPSIQYSRYSSIVVSNFVSSYPG